MTNPTSTGNSDRTSSQTGSKVRRHPPQRRSDLIYKMIEGEMVILNREAGVLHRLNPTASFIWECCDGASGIDDIVTQLAKAYDVDCLTCRKDVNETILKFDSLNLLNRQNSRES